MSNEENKKNPLIESFMKLHEKMIGYGGKDEPYQGRNQQRFTNEKNTPPALRAKPAAPKSDGVKPSPKPAQKPSAPAPSTSTGPVPIPKPRPDNLNTTPKPAAQSIPAIGSENSGAAIISKDGVPNAATKIRDEIYGGGPSTPAITPSTAPKYPLSLPNRTDIERSTLNAQDIADTKDNPAAMRAKMRTARQTIQGTNEETMVNKLINNFLKLQEAKPENMFEAAKKAKKDWDKDGKIESEKDEVWGSRMRAAKLAGKLKEAQDPNAEGIAKAGEKAPVMTTKPDYPTSKPGPTRELKTSLPKGVTVKANEEVEQIDEKNWIKGAIKHPGALHKQLGVPEGEKIPAGKLAAAAEKGGTLGKRARLAQTLKKVNEEDEVSFSEEELAYFASVLEAVAPSDENNTAFGKSGSRTGTLTDETDPKKKIKEEVEELDEEEAKKVPGKRGRKAGQKVGPYGPRGSKKGDNNEGPATTNVAHPHPFHQIRSSRPDTDGNYTVTHEAGGTVHTAKVPAKAAAQFHASYLAAGKPEIKNAITHSFISTHFPKAAKQKASGGITLPKMPAPKS